MKRMKDKRMKDGLLVASGCRPSAFFQSAFFHVLRPTPGMVCTRLMRLTVCAGGLISNRPLHHREFFVSASVLDRLRLVFVSEDSSRSSAQAAEDASLAANSLNELVAHFPLFRADFGRSYAEQATESAGVDSGFDQPPAQMIFLCTRSY